MGKISVVVTTYNHEKYIAQCLDSILSQKGNLLLEVIVGDDASSDGTRTIVQGYHNRHPKLVNLLPLQANLGITKNLKRCLDACNGDYIAICEGDDYWIDQYKLERQSACLTADPSLSMCFSAFLILHEATNRVTPFADQVLLQKDVITTEDLIERNYIGNFSCCMYRADVVRRLPQRLFEIFTVDWMFNMTCGELGGIGYIREPMSVYRKHAGGAWAGQGNVEQLTELRNLLDVYDAFFEGRYEAEFSRFRHKVDLELSWARERAESRNCLATSMSLISWVPESLRSLLRPAVHRLRRLSASAIKPLRPVGHGLRKDKVTPGGGTLDLVVLDTVFPHPLSPFRLYEFTEYLRHFPSSAVLSTGEDLPALKETRGISQVISDFEAAYPQLQGRTRVTTHDIGHHRARLGYAIFLRNMEVFLPGLERAGIPFVFTLYPGGAFEVDRPASDRALARICGSPQFRRVICTQRFTYDYLLRKGFCSSEQLEFIFGVVTQLPLHEIGEKKLHYGIDKATLDICFVAHKYMKGGVDKGYDVFVGTARRLVAAYDDVRFHVVGSIDETDLPVDGLRGRVTFYGLQPLSWFDRFYLDKDIILSPNIPFRSIPGQFDGFPTASCTDAGLRGVAVFCTDPLGMNEVFIDRRELVLIPHDEREIADTICGFHSAPEELKAIAERGRARMREVYGYERQMVPRIALLEEELAKAS